MRESLKDVFDKEFGDIETYMCCAHEYLDLLAGVASYSVHSRIRPWDHFAGAMMLEEGGGYVRKWDRSLYRPGDEYGGLITAVDVETYDKIYTLLLKKFVSEYDNAPVCKAG